MSAAKRQLSWQQQYLIPEVYQPLKTPPATAHTGKVCLFFRIPFFLKIQILNIKIWFQITFLIVHVDAFSVPEDDALGLSP